MACLPLTALPLGFFTILFFSSATSAQSDTGFLHKLMLASTAAGPESLAFDRLGEGPYTGVADGRVVKWQANVKRWQSFSFPSQWSAGICHSDEIHKEIECGRPLGLHFNINTGELYIADAYFGLMVVGPEGGWARTVAAEADGVPFMFTNGVDVDQETGAVYFTDSSTRFQRWDHELVVATGDATGRFMKYDPGTNQVTVLLQGLKFPNGVALSQDRTFVLIAGTTECLVWRYWLRGPKAGEYEKFAELTGYPDNIKRSGEGEFWVAINMERINFGGGGDVSKVAGVKLNGEGKVVEVLDGSVMTQLSEVEERNGTMWLGSVVLPFVGVYDK